VSTSMKMLRWTRSRIHYLVYIAYLLFLLSGSGIGGCKYLVLIAVSLIMCTCVIGCRNFSTRRLATRKSLATKRCKLFHFIFVSVTSLLHSLIVDTSTTSKVCCHKYVVRTSWHYVFNYRKELASL